MAGLVPAIYVFNFAKKGVDARDKPGHDKRKIDVARFFKGGLNRHLPENDQ